MGMKHFQAVKSDQRCHGKSDTRIGENNNVLCWDFIEFCIFWNDSSFMRLTVGVK